MNGLSTLEREHRTIQRFLAALHTLLADACIVGPWRPELLLAAEFIDVFIADFHQRREGKALLELLVARGIHVDVSDAPFSHDSSAFDPLRSALHAALSRPEANALEEAADCLRALADILEEHAARESRLYQRIHGQLSAADDRELAHRLATRVPDDEAVLAHADSLLRRLGVPPLEEGGDPMPHRV